MILLADENIDLSVAARLRAAGHEVFAVAEMAPGVTDLARTLAVHGPEMAGAFCVLTPGSLRIRQRPV